VASSLLFGESRWNKLHGYFPILVKLPARLTERSTGRISMRLEPVYNSQIPIRYKMNEPWALCAVGSQESPRSNRVDTILDTGENEE